MKLFIIVCINYLILKCEFYPQAEAYYLNNVDSNSIQTIETNNLNFRRNNFMPQNNPNIQNFRRNNFMPQNNPNNINLNNHEDFDNFFVVKPHFEGGKSYFYYNLHKQQFLPREISLIYEVILNIQKYTCIIFIPRCISNNCINIVKTNEDRPFTSYYNGYATVNMNNLKNQNYFIYAAYHEIFHALSLFHEQQRFDRDKYMLIDYNNLQKSDYVNYYKKNTPQYGVPFNPLSIMMYDMETGSRMFNKPVYILKNGNNYIKESSGCLVYPQESDIRKLCSMFKCQMCLREPFQPRKPNAPLDEALLKKTDIFPNDLKCINRNFL